MNNKKRYEKPAMRVVELKHKTMLLSGSPDPYGSKDRDNPYEFN